MLFECKGPAIPALLRFGLSYCANTAQTNSLYCVWHNHPLLFLSWVMKKVFLILGLIVLALLLPFFFTDVGRHEGADHNAGLPWQIEVDGTGSSQVFGVVLGRDRLGDMLSVLGAEPELAIIAAPGEAGSLEAYFSELRLGFVLAKVVLTLDATPEMLAAMAERAPKAEYMESSTRKIRLMETIMHAGTCLGGWSSALLHKNIVAAYELPAYTINQLRYDLRKMQAHGLVERDGKHYSYRLTE